MSSASVQSLPPTQTKVNILPVFAVVEDGIAPNPDCAYCHGSGYVQIFDWIDIPGSLEVATGEYMPCHCTAAGELPY